MEMSLESKTLDKLIPTASSKLMKKVRKVQRNNYLPFTDSKDFKTYFLQILKDLKLERPEHFKACLLWLKEILKCKGDYSTQQQCVKAAINEISEKLKINTKKVEESTQSELRLSEKQYDTTTPNFLKFGEVCSSVESKHTPVVNSAASPVWSTSSPIRSTGSPIRSTGSPVDQEVSPSGLRGSPVDVESSTGDSTKQSVTVSDSSLKLPSTNQDPTEGDKWTVDSGSNADCESFIFDLDATNHNKKFIADVKRKISTSNKLAMSSLSADPDGLKILIDQQSRSKEFSLYLNGEGTQDKRDAIAKRIKESFPQVNVKFVTSVTFHLKSILLDDVMYFGSGNWTLHGLTIQIQNWKRSYNKELIKTVEDYLEELAENTVVKSEHIRRQNNIARLGNLKEQVEKNISIYPNNYLVEQMIEIANEPMSWKDTRQKLSKIKNAVTSVSNLFENIADKELPIIRMFLVPKCGDDLCRLLLHVIRKAKSIKLWMFHFDNEFLKNKEGFLEVVKGQECEIITDEASSKEGPMAKTLQELKANKIGYKLMKSKDSVNCKLHTKFLIIDGTHLFHGSANLTLPGVFDNAEICEYSRNEEEIRAYSQLFGQISDMWDCSVS